MVRMERSLAGIGTGRIATRFGAPASHSRERRLGLARHALWAGAGTVPGGPGRAEGRPRIRDHRGIIVVKDRRPRSGTLRREPRYHWTGAAGSGRRRASVRVRAPWHD